jgi:hypothetical protein
MPCPNTRLLQGTNRTRKRRDRRHDDDDDDERMRLGVESERVVDRRHERLACDRLLVGRGGVWRGTKGGGEGGEMCGGTSRALTMGLDYGV